jgi:AcrR family transcriptional regulator
VALSKVLRVVAPASLSRTTRVRRRAPGEKREQIAAAAAALFAELGYAGATTARIAERADVSEGIVFHHFGSKRDLFRSVVADYGREFVRAMFGDDPAAEPASPRQAIAAGFAFVRDHQELHRVFSPRDSELAALVEQGTHDPIVAALEKTLQAAVERGVARDMRVRVVAELCYALVDGALRACFLEGDGSCEDEYLAEAIHCVERATAPSPEPRNPS